MATTKTKRKVGARKVTRRKVAATRFRRPPRRVRRALWWHKLEAVLRARACPYGGVKWLYKFVDVPTFEEAVAQQVQGRRDDYPLRWLIQVLGLTDEVRSHLSLNQWGYRPYLYAVTRSELVRAMAKVDVEAALGRVAARFAAGIDDHSPWSFDWPSGQELDEYIAWRQADPKRRRAWDEEWGHKFGSAAP